MAIEVVVDHETALQLGALRDALARLAVAEVHSRAETVTGEAGPGVVRLVPSAVLALRVDQEADAAADRALVRAIARCEQREQRPGRLRRRARPTAAKRVVHIRGAGLAP